MRITTYRVLRLIAFFSPFGKGEARPSKWGILFLAKALISKIKMVNRIISTNSFSRKFNSPSAKRGLFIGFMPIGIFFLFIFLFMSLLNTWYHSDTMKLAFKIETLKQEKELLKDELIKLNIEVERLTSPKRVREVIAPKLNMVFPESGPVELKK